MPHCSTHASADRLAVAASNHDPDAEPIPEPDPRAITVADPDPNTVANPAPNVAADPGADAIAVSEPNPTTNPEPDRKADAVPDSASIVDFADLDPDDYTDILPDSYAPAGHSDRVAVHSKNFHGLTLSDARADQPSNPCEGRRRCRLRRGSGSVSPGLRLSERLSRR